MWLEASSIAIPSPALDCQIGQFREQSHKAKIWRHRHMTKEIVMTRTGIARTALATFMATLVWMPAYANTSTFELRITNDTKADLTFRWHDGQSKHANMTYNKKSVDAHTIKAGTSDTIGIQPTARKCAPNCGACTPAIGKIYAYYKDKNGDEQRNNYYEARYEFFEYCGVAANKPITAYTSNWDFDHGDGKGDEHYKHKQKSSNKAYTSSNPAKGLTFDAKRVSGHANITYSEK